MDRILLKNISVGGRPSDILIEGTTISRIIDSGTSTDFAEKAEVVDCTGRTALPGFVNAHTHAAMSMMRGIGEDIFFSEWIDRIWQKEKFIDEEYVYHATKVACIEMIKTGTTTFYDQYWFPKAAAKAVDEMGIRAILSYVHLDHFDHDKSLRQRKECEEIFEESASWPSNINFAIAIHSIYAVSEDQIRWAAEFARSHGLRIDVHLSETRPEVDECFARHGVSPVKFADDLGLLGPDVSADHTLWISDDDIRILAERQVSCVHNPNSNLKLASGYQFRYNELRDAGVNICIGTDGCASSNNLDILEAMKTAAIVQKAWRGDPAALPLDQLLAMATENGAKAMGLNTGKIEEGALADILIVNTDNTFFLSDAPFLANFVYSAHSDCIESVICNGRFVMRNRQVEGEKEILTEARKALSKITKYL